MTSIRAGIALAVAAAGLAAGYAGLAQSKQAPQAARKQSRTVEVTADVIKHNDATGIGSGKNFVILDGETRVKGQDGKWNDKTRVAEATGDLTMTDPQADATSKKAIIHYSSAKRIIEMLEDVTITIRPKKDAAKAAGPATVSLENGTARVKEDDEEPPRKHPAVITCDRAEYHYARDKKYARLTGNFRVVQKLKDLTRNVTADHAEWFGTEDRILLHPPVHFEDTKGKIFDTDNPVTLHTTEGAETIEATKVRIIFPVEDEEEKPAAKPAAQPKKP